MKNRFLRAVTQAALTGIAVAGGADAYLHFERLTQTTAGTAERDEVMGALTRELDRRWNEVRHYNPESADEPAWYGASPRAFPPGRPEPWASDSRWNRMSYRPADPARYRYMLYTHGDEAFLFSIGDADGDGALSQVHRRFKAGVLAQEWTLDPEE